MTYPVSPVEILKLIVPFLTSSIISDVELKPLESWSPECFCKRSYRVTVKVWHRQCGIIDARSFPSVDTKIGELWKAFENGGILNRFLEFTMLVMSVNSIMYCPSRPSNGGA